MNNKVYVDNLPAVTRENDLMVLFSPYGNVAEVNVPMDRVTGRQRGFGCVIMATPEGARSAIRALNGKSLGASTLAVREARPNEHRGASSSQH